MSIFVPSKAFTCISSIANRKNISKPSQNIEDFGQFGETESEMFTSIGRTNERRVSDRYIQVTAVGEVSLPPDRCRVSIRIHSQKDNSHDAKNSVQRRLDYVLQTLHNHSIKDTDMQVHKSLKRVETMYEMDADVLVTFLDFHKCQSACNVLVEKLDDTVTVAAPEYYHASTSLETLRQQASLLAVHNAKLKAQEMARFVHQGVGRPISMQEAETKEWEGQGEGVTETDTRPATQLRMAQATVTVRCTVNVTFELKTKAKTKSYK